MAKCETQLNLKLDTGTKVFWQFAADKLGLSMKKLAVVGIRYYVSKVHPEIIEEFNTRDRG